MPNPQEVHVVNEVSADENFPATQLLHDSCPGPLYLPPLHAVQTEEPAPAKVPEAQVEHEVEPREAANVPLGHSEQELSPAPEILPFGQRVHVDDANVLYFPGEQKRQSSQPSEHSQSPVHSAPSTVEEAEYWPAVQGEQALELPPGD